ncbi:MAG: hypothetical protein H6834_14130 [Planctomycetes bacterium]|nr:hypothetical protein [Planctomycetota bacterium]
MRNNEAGSVKLTMVMSMALTIGAFVLTTMTLTSSQIFRARQQSYRARAEALAGAGIEAGISWVKQAQNLATLQAPFHGLDTLSKTEWSQIFDDEPVQVNGQTVGFYDVWVRHTMTSGNDPLSRDLELRSEGYYQHGQGSSARGAVEHRIVRTSLRPSEVFDYAYFINNWGWLYIDNLEVNGNVRANGQFDFGGYRPTINASKRFDKIVRRPDGSHDLIDYRDDGGVYSGWDIINQSKVRGKGGRAENQYAYQEAVSMPNLTDLGMYEALATQHNSSVTVSQGLASPRTFRNVVGDDPGEPQNLYLEGTSSKPIVLDGPLIVRGNVFIKGYVTGQGAIYAGGNIYVGDDLVYKNPPTTARPRSDDEADVEAWIDANAGKDTLGLYARENIVVGNADSSDFTRYVDPWLRNASNRSDEDAGMDGIHNTRKGRDGIMGTEDDDVLEDGNWTVERYTAQQEALGLIPPGKYVGDVIPGTGEDIDGDGVEDGTIRLNDLQMSSATWNSSWAGNRPSGKSYSQLTTNSIAHLDAAFYTNHTFAMRATQSPVTMNGTVVSRNEAIVVQNSAIWNHDARLLGGGNMFGFYLPVQWDRIRTWPVRRVEERGSAPTGGGVSN